MGRVGIRTLDNLISIIQRLREGPAKPFELEKELTISHGQVDRIVKALLEAQLVEKLEDGKLMMSGSKFETRASYEIYMKHSSKLLEEEISTSPGIDIGHEPELFERMLLNIYGEKCKIGENLLTHLKTGYPKIYWTYKKHVKTNENLKIIIEKLIEDVHKDMRIWFTKRKLILPVVSETVYVMALNDLLAEEEEYPPPSVALNLKEGIVRFGSAELTRGNRETLSCLIESIERVKEIWGAQGKEFAELRIRDKNTYGELRAEIEKLKNKVEHHTPLRGFCDLCPSVHVED